MFQTDQPSAESNDKLHFNGQIGRLIITMVMRFFRFLAFFVHVFVQCQFFAYTCTLYIC